MRLVDVLKKISMKQSCTRCKKIKSSSEFKQIGEHYFCTECVTAEGKIFPEYLLLRTPFILKDEAQITKTLTCPICKKETANPFFYSPSPNDSPCLFTWIGEQRLCYFCARDQLPALKESGKAQKGETYLFYSVSDSDTEISYWDNAIMQANNERQKTKLNEPPKNFELVDRTIIYEYYNPNNDDMMDDSTSLDIYANAERTLWCFKLKNDFLSGWDGWPVWRGGFITPEQFKEFMERMKLKHNLPLFRYDEI